jgi:hypothetical protein
MYKRTIELDAEDLARAQADWEAAEDQGHDWNDYDDRLTSMVRMATSVSTGSLSYSRLPDSRDGLALRMGGEAPGGPAP